MTGMTGPNLVLILLISARFVPDRSGPPQTENVLLVKVEKTYTKGIQNEESQFAEESARCHTCMTVVRPDDGEN